MSQPLHEEWKNPGAAFRGKAVLLLERETEKRGRTSLGKRRPNRCLTSFVLGNRGWLTSTKSRAQASPGRIYSI